MHIQTLSHIIAAEKGHISLGIEFGSVPLLFKYDTLVFR